jgi:pyruvate/2-oxoglutarate dehydrogenase complex dihydrolipoamide acyltransferase (E2) component
MITIEDEAEDLRDMFRKMDMYDALPPEGPGGEEDLKFCYRVVKNSRGQDCAYYSVVCESAGQEFKFGILSNGTGIFPKGWEPIQRGAFRERYEEAEEPEPAPRAAKQQPPNAPADPVAGLKPNENADLDARAKRFVDENGVSREGGLYKVKPNDKVTYEIWKNGVGRVVCNCARFEEQGETDPEFRCEHIRAVALFIKPRPVAA